MATGGSAITFNPAWVSYSTIQNNGLRPNSANITNYVIKGEILNTVQSCYGIYLGIRPYGTNIYKDSKKSSDPIGKHSLDNF